MDMIISLVSIPSLNWLFKLIKSISIQYLLINEIKLNLNEQNAGNLSRIILYKFYRYR